MPSLQSSPETAATFGRYRVVRLLGEGGMAQVFLGVPEPAAGDGEFVVIKRILPHLADDPELIDGFLNEARISARLNHPKIVAVVEFGSQDGTPYMVMEYVPGVDLDRLIEVHGPLPFGALYAVLHDIAEAFVYAHTAGPDRTPLIHRDISPSNLLIRPEGTCIVSDFGLSKSLGDQSAAAETVSGKADFFAPETLKGEGHDVRTDLFAIGVTLYQALTGTLPFEGETQFDTFRRIVAGERKPVRELRPDCPDALVAIVDRLLEVDPDRRYQSAHELLKDLPRLRGKSRLELGRLVHEVSDRRRSPASMGSDPSERSGPRPISPPAVVGSYRSAPVRVEEPKAAPAPERSSKRALLLGALFGALAVGAVSLALFFFLLAGDAEPEEGPRVEGSPRAVAVEPTEPREAEPAETEPAETEPAETERASANEPSAAGEEARAEAEAAGANTADDGTADDGTADDGTTGESAPAAKRAPARPGTRSTKQQAQTQRARTPAGPAALEQAQACLARGDSRCARDVLSSRGRTAAERALLIDLHRQSGQIPQMLDAMETFVRRFPSAPQTARYVEDLRRYGRR